MPVGAWGVLGWVAFGLALTALTSWLVARIWGQAWPGKLSLTNLVADGMWAALLAAAALLAMRYIERLSQAWLGYLAFGGIALLLSLVRAVLYRRVVEEGARRPPADGAALRTEALRLSLYLVFALTVYLLGAWLVEGWADPLLFLPLGIGALLPDLDSPDSLVGRWLPFLSRRLEARLGSGEGWHTPAAAALVAALTAPLLLVIPVRVWLPVPLGFLCHLVVDLLTPQGVMLLWPWSRARIRLGAGVLAPARGTVARWVALGLGVAVGALLLVVDLVPPPPPPVPPPTYEQALERYHSIQGRYLALADVAGIWNAAGRRVDGRFEILNALGSSFVLLDRYTGRVFRAGREQEDHLYLERITVLAGTAVRVKPAEVHLEDQRLADALPVLYQMQREEGLQHVYVSGDLVLPPDRLGAEPALQPEYPQMYLPRVEAREGGRVRLNYLTAAELIALAEVRVDTADLVIVATYATPATGPTVTPLPSPPGGTSPAGAEAP